MKVELIEVTPQQAGEWLLVNKRNRKLRDDIVDSLITEYNAGRWNPAVGQPIMFDVDGLLDNGQHRLTMCVRLNKTIPMCVIFDAPEGTFWLVDDNFNSRSLSQRLSIEGYDETTTLAPAATTFLMIEKALLGTGMLDANFKATDVDRRLTIENRSELRTWVQEVRTISKKHKFYAPATVAAWATAADLQGSASTSTLLHTFVEKLHSLDMVSSSGTIANARAAVVACGTSKVGRVRALLILSRAWKAYCAGEEMSVFRIDSNTKIVFPKRVTR